METWNRLTAARGKWGGREWRDEGEGTSQRKCVNDPRHGQQCGGSLWERGRGGLGGAEESTERGEIGTTVNRINKNLKTQKILNKKKKERLDPFH